MKKTSLKLVAISIALLMAITGCSSNKTQTRASAYKSITTEELSANIGDDKWVVVDTEDNNAFNGWALDGVKRGGHIEGAVDFSANWLGVEKEGKRNHT